MDRASVLILMLDMSLGTHPGIDNGRLCELVDNARNALSDIYQEAASIAFEETSRETETAMHMNLSELPRRPRSALLGTEEIRASPPDRRPAAESPGLTREAPRPASRHRDGRS